MPQRVYFLMKSNRVIAHYDGDTDRKIGKVIIRSLFEKARDKIVLVSFVKEQILSYANNIVLLKDGMPLRFTVSYKVVLVDPIKYVNYITKLYILNTESHFVDYVNYHPLIKAAIDDGIKKILTEYELEDLLRSVSISIDSLNEINSSLDEYGLEVKNVKCNTLIFTKTLTDAFNKKKIVSLESQIELERVKGEVAKNRALVNSSNMYKEHPELLLAQYVDIMRSSKGSSFIISYSIVDSLKKSIVEKK